MAGEGTMKMEHEDLPGQAAMAARGASRIEAAAATEGRPAWQA
jgi:hypothetical protein